jgi:hypothetical protein
MGLDDRVPQRRAADDRGQLQLVAARHEDAGRLTDRLDQVGVVRLLAALGPDGHHLASTQPPEQGVVHLDDLVAEGRRGGDQRDPGLGTAAGRHELLEDRALAQLVLGPADHQQRSGRGPVGRRVCGRVGGRRHDTAG